MHLFLVGKENQPQNISHAMAGLTEHAPLEKKWFMFVFVCLLYFKYCFHLFCINLYHVEFILHLQGQELQYLIS
jgi:hypothetical protein